MRFLDVVDILIVALFLYQMLLWLRGTAGIQLLRGLIVLLVLYVAAENLQLRTVHWLLEKFVTVLLVMTIIVFQPELRRGLVKLGRGTPLRHLGLGSDGQGARAVREIIDAVMTMSEEKTGALIVMESHTGLNEFLESGIRIDAPISTELLLSIFSTASPLHDGAVIIQEDRMAAAGCLLPLSESRYLDKRLGTRHRAAVGLSEQSDALIVVVSERTGTISIAENGFLSRFLTKEILEERVFKTMSAPAPKVEFWPWKRRPGEPKAS